MNLKENDIVLCTVKSIEGTAIFVQIENNGLGNIIMSEIAAGRIRNLREYVHPNKKIVCKVLKIYQDHAELSLRRVTSREKEEIQSRYDKERTFNSMLKVITKSPEQIIEKIKEKYELWDFFDKIKEDSGLLENFMKKSEADSLIKILEEKKEREKIVKRIIILKSNSESGISDIKDILKVKNICIYYLGSSQFSIEAKAIEYKEAESILNKAISQIEAKAKEKKAFFEYKEK